jgi:amidase
VMPGDKLDPACSVAVDKTVRLLDSLGHHVVEADPGLDLDFIARFWRMNASVGAHVTLSRREAALGRKLTENDVETVTWTAYQAGGRITAAELSAGIQEVHLMGRRLAEFHRDHDVFLTPTLAQRPVKLGHLSMMVDDVDAYWDRLFRFIPFTPQQNLSGQPAISLPLHWSEDGLPIGVQFAARFGDEETLLRLARQIEQAAPWADRVPPVSAG